MLLRRVCVLDIPHGRLARSNRLCRILGRRVCHRRRRAVGMALIPLSWKSCQHYGRVRCTRIFQDAKAVCPLSQTVNSIHSESVSSFANSESGEIAS
jgi:hypothetical protein